ncbi:MAG: hypothetical protein ACRYFX_00940 [Janthinobacterium lividum]
MDLSVVTPVFNEEATIATLHRRSTALLVGLVFLVMRCTFYSRFVTREYQPGWASLMVSILFLGGVQLIAVGIIGEYLARLGANVRPRPLYIVAENNLPRQLVSG